MKQYKFKDLVLAAIIGGVVFGSIGVAAVTLTADQVKYTPSNEKFTATNAKDALDEIYKIAEYEIPADTYFYDSNTSGEEIVRYKKVDGKYFLCDANGKITSETEQDIATLTLIEYTSAIASNLSIGKAGYASNNFILGDGNDIESYYNTITVNITTYVSFVGGTQGNSSGNNAIGARNTYNIVFQKQSDGTFKCTSNSTGMHASINWNGIIVSGIFYPVFEVNSITFS